MIIQDYSQQIEDFEGYLKSKLASINEISGNDNVLFKKILYVSFLDSLSSCVYPGRGNKERFVSMLEKFSKWEDRDRVSLPHLGRFFQLSSDPLLEQARKYVTPKLKNWQKRSGYEILISEDPKFCDIEDKSWKTNKDSGLNVSLADFKHTFLLYQPRNALVHQFQSRGDEMNKLRQFEQPYYQHETTFYGTLDIKPLRFVLIYPTQFLKGLSEKTLVNIVLYLKDGNINPFPHYYAGDYWITELK